MSAFYEIPVKSYIRSDRFSIEYISLTELMLIGRRILIVKDGEPVIICTVSNISVHRLKMTISKINNVPVKLKIGDNYKIYDISNLDSLSDEEVEALFVLQK